MHSAADVEGGCGLCRKIAMERADKPCSSRTHYFGCNAKTVWWQGLLLALMLLYMVGMSYEMYCTRKELLYLKAQTKADRSMNNTAISDNKRSQRVKKKRSVLIDGYTSNFHPFLPQGNEVPQAKVSEVDSDDVGRSRLDYAAMRAFADGRGDTSDIASTFVIWGKTACLHGNPTIYSGYAAAAYPMPGYGGSTNLECLPEDPSWNTNSRSAGPITTTQVAAVKYFIGHHTGVYPSSANNSVIGCAVCSSSRSPTLMIPGRVECPDDIWRKQYDGYLMSTPGIASQYYFSSKNYCVAANIGDGDYFTGHNDTQGPKLTFVQAGSCYKSKEPCKDYPQGKLLGCTVCSKLSDLYYRMPKVG